MSLIYLLLGSNIGDSVAHLSVAKNHVEKQIGPVINASGIYKTAAWGNRNQADFFNQVLIAETGLDPHQTLLRIFSIEKDMGRVRSQKNAPRIIDIDILFFKHEIIHSPDLIVPHPEIQNRRFVLIPLTELLPGFVHPIFNKTVEELLRECSDKLNVQKI